MRLLISEFLTSGGRRDEPLATPLLAEGRAMLVALLEDAAAHDGVSAVTTWDDRLPPPAASNIEIHPVPTRAAYDRQLLALAASCHRTLLIAPECDGILETQVAQVERACGPGALRNASRDAIRLCGDKLRLAEFLRARSILTPQTVSLSELPLDIPLTDHVVKPRDGAGCESTFRIRGGTPRDLRSTRPLDDRRVVQPRIDGPALSSAAIVSESEVALLPLGEQFVAGESQLAYSGGEIPWPGNEADIAEVEARRIALEILELIPGLSGWIGFDWVWSTADRQLVLIEINPRLTTSYLGYRQWFGGNLCAALLGFGTVGSPRAGTAPIRFTKSAAGMTVSTGNRLAGIEAS